MENKLKMDNKMRIIVNVRKIFAFIKLYIPVRVSFALAAVVTVMVIEVMAVLVASAVVNQHLYLTCLMCALTSQLS